MMKKKYLGYFIGLFIFAVVISIITENIIESNTPDFVLEKYEELKEDKVLMDSIGGFKSFEYTFNKNQYESKKELKYIITIFGIKKDLRFEGVQSKEKERGWVLSKSKIVIE